MRQLSTVSALLLLLTLVVAASGKGMMTGGWREMSQEDMDNSEGFQASLTAATAAYNDKLAVGSKGDTNGSGAARLQRVEKAWQQVVSGMNYKFRARMVPACDSGDDCESRSCEFVVWHQAWNKKEPTRVQKIDC